MKLFSSLVLAICLPLLSFAQQDDKTFLGANPTFFFNYKYMSNFDHLQANQLGLGVELYDRFDIEITTSYSTITNNAFFNILSSPVEGTPISYKGQLQGAALTYRALPNKKLRPIIGFGIESGRVENEYGNSVKNLTRTYARTGVDYQVFDLLTIGANVYYDILTNTRYTKYGKENIISTADKHLSNHYFSFYTRIYLRNIN